MSLQFRFGPAAKWVHVKLKGKKICLESFLDSRSVYMCAYELLPAFYMRKLRLRGTNLPKVSLPANYRAGSQTQVV